MGIPVFSPNGQEMSTLTGEVKLLAILVVLIIMAALVGISSSRRAHRRRDSYAPVVVSPPEVHPSPIQPMVRPAPSPPAGVLGREAERLAVERGLSAGRPVLLYGTAGMGKTTLALTLAERRRMVAVVTAGQRPLEDICAEAVRNLGDPTFISSSLPQAAQRLMELATPESLVILDDVAPGRIQELADVLTSGAIVVVCDGMVENVPHFWEGQPLGPIMRPASLELLRRHAGWDDIAPGADALCAACGDMPLALEIAGHLLREGIPLDSFVASLRGQQSLAATDPLSPIFAIAVDRLGGRATAPVRALAAFSLLGNDAAMTSEALAAAVAGVREAVEGDLRRLSEIGLLRQVGDRWALPAGLRPLARACVGNADMEEAGERLARYYLDLARVARRDRAILETERDNLLTMLAWCIEEHRKGLAVDYMWALDEYLDLAGHRCEEERRLRQTISIAQSIGDHQSAASFAYNLAILLVERGQDAEALRFFEESLRLERRLRDRAGIAQTLYQMGAIYERRGDLRRAADLYESSLKGEKGLRNTEGIAQTSLALARVVAGQGQRAWACELVASAAQLYESLGHQRGLAQCQEMERALGVQPP